MKILSLCTGMGLLDRAFLDEGFDVVPGCEIDPEQRLLYRQLCGGEPLTEDIKDLIGQLGKVYNQIDGIIGGPPCQSFTKLKSIRKPKFPDLTPQVKEILDVVNPRWYMFENVARLDIPGASYIRLDAMHFAKPHQSRPRWFTYSPYITPPKAVYSGSIDSLMAYVTVAGRNHGPKRGAILQGYPLAAGLEAPCVILQKGLANAVHYDVARAWARSIKANL